MLSFRTALTASAIAFAFSTSAFAQNISMELSDRTGMIVDTGGKVMRFTANDRGHAMMMKYGHPVKAGTIFYMSGGTLYMASDRRMASGDSLREMLISATP